MSANRAKPPSQTGTQTVEAVLGYLQHRMPGYPFDPQLDDEFVRELIDDFAAQVDVLEETKGFRWFYSQPPGPPGRSIRLALRRWIANARQRRPGPGTPTTQGT